MEKYLAQNKVLMNQFKNCRTEGVIDFVYDGIVHPKTWFNERGERILFFLKEAYSRTNDIEWDLTKWLCSEKCTDKCDKDCSECWPRGSTYNHVAEQAYMIINQTDIFDAWLGVSDKNKIDYLKSRCEILKKIAIVNIKKYSGERTSRDGDLRCHLEKNRIMLQQQIELIRPTVIVCGGTYPYLKEILSLPDLDNSYNGSIVLGGIKIIATYHPNKRMTSKNKAEKVYTQYRLLKGD